MTKNFIFSLMVAMVLAGAVALPVLAAPNIGFEDKGLTKAIATGGGYDPGVSELTLSQSIGQVIRVVLSLVGTIFFVLTIYAGFLWMTASGNEEQVTKATDILKAAAIGIVITMAAYGITAFVVIYVNQSTTGRGTAIGGAPKGCCVITNGNTGKVSCEKQIEEAICDQRAVNNTISNWVSGGTCPPACN